MNDADGVTVYSFLVSDAGPKHWRLAAFKASRETIQRAYGGRVLEGTAQRVPRNDLDAEGRLRRVATGWGEAA